MTALLYQSVHTHSITVPLCHCGCLALTQGRLAVVSAAVVASGPTAQQKRAPGCHRTPAASEMNLHSRSTMQKAAAARAQHTAGMALSVRRSTYAAAGAHAVAAHSELVLLTQMAANDTPLKLLAGPPAARVLEHHLMHTQPWALLLPSCTWPRP
jgi:hypothetical protein